MGNHKKFTRTEIARALTARKIEIACAAPCKHRDCLHGVVTHSYAISRSFVAGKPVLRLYEGFGFQTVEAKPDAVVMQRKFQ